MLSERLVGRTRILLKKVDCILQILFSSYSISLLFNQSLIVKIKKHFNQFTMSVLFCVILFYRFFLVSAAALRSTTVGSEQMSTGHLVIFASLRSVQSGHPLDVLHLCNPAGGYISWGIDSNH